METTTNYSVPVVTNKNQGKVLVPGRSAGSDAPLPLPKREVSSAEIDVQLRQAQARRENALRQAANTFVLSDQRFTIYKDLSGQFVTRFTSLRDGKVTYIPEPDVLSWLNQSNGSATSTLSLEV